MELSKEFYDTVLNEICKRMYCLFIKSIIAGT